jgi:hypothetical protein
MDFGATVVIEDIMLTEFVMLPRRFWEEVFWNLPAALIRLHILFETSGYYLSGNLLTLEDPCSHEIPLCCWYLYYVKMAADIVGF